MDSPRGRETRRSSFRRSRRRRSRTGRTPARRRWRRTPAPPWPRPASASPRRPAGCPRSPRRQRQSSSGCTCRSHAISQLMFENGENRSEIVLSRNKSHVENSGQQNLSNGGKLCSKNVLQTSPPGMSSI